MTIHPSKVLYTLDTQIARYLEGDLGVYRPAIGPGRHSIHFSSEKRSKVLDFPLSEKQKHLKSVLGLVNYFRDHVEGLSVLTKPLTT